MRTHPRAELLQAIGLVCPVWLEATAELFPCVRVCTRFDRRAVLLEEHKCAPTHVLSAFRL